MITATNQPVMTSTTNTKSLGAQYVLYNGPLFIGTMFNWALFGTVTLQVYLYHTSGFKDSKWIKGLVNVIFVLDIMQTVFSTHNVWQLIILGWGNPAALEHPPWTSVTLPIMSGLIGGLVQIFFSWRIWALKKNTWAACVSIMIVMIAIMQCSSGIVFSIRSLFIDIFDIAELHSGIVVWLVGAFSADIIIVIAMLYILHSSKRTKFAPTNRLIDRLMIQTIHSGAIPAVAALVELVLFLVTPNTFLHDCPVLFLGKLYSNVLLANLNGRRKNDTTFSNVYLSQEQTGASDVDFAARNVGRSDTQLNTDAIEIKTFKVIEINPADSQV